jgi:lipoprotein-releasing system permease protein
MKRRGALAPGFEWFVAWRHLRDPELRSPVALIVGLALLVVAAWCLGVYALVPIIAGRHGHGALELAQSRAGEALQVLMIVGAVALVAGLLVTLLGVIMTNFTVFTALSIFGVFLGTGPPIIALSVMSGFEADLRTKIRASKADVLIGMAETGDAPAPFTDWRDVQQKIADVRGVVASIAFIETEVIIKHATNPSGMGIILRGIEPSTAAKVLDLRRTLLEGKVDYLDHPEQIPRDEPEILRAPPDDDEGAPGRHRDEAPARPVLPGILIGEELYSHTLRVFLGSDVDVVCPLCGVGPTGPMPRLKPFRVAGHFYTGMYEFDSKLAYISLAEAQRFLNMPGEVTGIEVLTPTPDHADKVAAAIAQRLGPRYEVRTWEELNRGLFSALKLEKIAMFVVLTFIVLVASFSVVATLLMLATEKAREIAILKSMGARDGAVMRIFVAEGLYIGLLGVAIGLVVGIGGCILLSHNGLPLDPDVYYIQKLPVVMRATEITLISISAIALCCVATLYPAFLASRMRPVEGLRYD